MNDKKKNNSKKIVSTIFLVIVLFVGVAIGYYSAFYFTNKDKNNDSSKNYSVVPSDIEIKFKDGPEVKMNNKTLKNPIIKTFKIKNTGNQNFYYDIYLDDVTNNFLNKSNLIYTLSSDDGGANAFETQIPSSSSKIVTNKLIPANVTHNYTLKIEYKGVSDNLDVDGENYFSSIIKINEVK